MGLFLVAALGLVLYFSKPEPASRFVYQEFVKDMPEFETTQERLTQERKYAELGAYIETQGTDKADYTKEKIYLQYIALRAYVNAARLNSDDTQSLDQVMRLGQMLLNDQKVSDVAPQFVAYSVDVIDRLVYPSTPRSVRSVFVTHPAFTRFTNTENPVDINTFRINLLQFGNSLYRVTNIKMKLTLLAMNRLRKSQNSPTAFDIQHQEVKLLMQEAESSLILDRQAQAYPFGQRGYLAETLLTKATVAQEYAALTKQTPWGAVTDLYEQALQEAREYSPTFVSKIQTSYNQYLQSLQ